MNEPPASPPRPPPAAEESPVPIQVVMPRIGFSARWRAYLITGLLVTAPAVFTFYVAWVVIRFVDSRAAGLIPPLYNPNTYLPFSIPGIGVLVLLALLTLIGMVTTGYLGRVITRTTDRMLARVPFVRAIYGATKQVMETILSTNSTTFRQVVLIEYPRREMWSVGFMTGSVRTRLRGQDEEMVNVFLPSTPNPAMGYLMFVPRRDVIVLDLPVEDGIKLVMSGGIVSPSWLREHVALPDGTSGSEPGPALPSRTPQRGRRAS